MPNQHFWGGYHYILVVFYLDEIVQFFQYPADNKKLLGQKKCKKHTHIRKAQNSKTENTIQTQKK